MGNLVVLVRVQTEVGKLVTRDHCTARLLSFLLFLQFFGIIVLESSKAANFDLACSHGAPMVNNNSNARILNLLHGLFSLHVNT